MAGKKTKTKSSAKPAKKTAKKAKKAPAKQAAAKKGAKKAASKKAAPKKAAAKKAAPKKQSAAKRPTAKKPPAKKPAAEPIEVVEVVESADTVDTEAAEASPSLQAEILSMARQLYGDRPDAELLALDPNDVDAMDPSMFYELLGEKYGVEADPDNESFGGFGGPISKLIAFVESRWDGKTRKDTPMPPGQWLEEYVHPES